MDIDRIKAHYAGIREGLTMFAWWQGGIQQVGTCGTTLREALADVDSIEKEAIASAGQLFEPKEEALPPSGEPLGFDKPDKDRLLTDLRELVDRDYKLYLEVYHWLETFWAEHHWEFPMGPLTRYLRDKLGAAGYRLCPKETWPIAIQYGHETGETLKAKEFQRDADQEACQGKEE